MRLIESKNHNWESSPTVYDLVLFARFVKRFKWIFILLIAGTMAVSFYYYHTHTYYTSRITFLVNSSNVAEILWDRSAEAPIDVMNDDRGYNRINQIIYSSQMLD